MSWIITGTEKNKGLLDEFSGAAAAYSLRDLSVRRNAPVVRVRRSSDNTEQDFTAAQITDGTLTAFCGAGDGFVRTWYDQSGNGNNALAAIQPKIVSSGTVLTTSGKPELQATDGYFNLANPFLFNNAPGASIFTVQYPRSTGPIYGHPVSCIQGGFISHYGGGNLYENIGFSSRQLISTTLGGSRTLYSLTTDNSSTSGFVNSVQLYVRSGGSGYRDRPFNVVVDDYTGSTIFGLQEIIVYAINQSANRTAIEANINAHYGIF